MKFNLNLIFNKIFKILKIKSVNAGLEISDSWLRYVYLKDNELHFIGLHLPPNIIVNGRIKDYDLFLKSLYELRYKILNNQDIKNNLNIIVSLSSIDVYSQIFTLPIIEGENLEKAIKLNIQMLSPQDESQTYNSWQIVNRDQKLMRLEILSAFIDKNIINDFKKALIEAKFMPWSIESYSFSLTRFFARKVRNFDLSKNYLILIIDDSGIKSLIIRSGNLYFNYFSPWSEILKEENKISWDKFEIFLIRHINQVINFYNSRWSDEINGLFLMSSVFRKEIKEIINQNFNLSVLEINLDFPIDIPLEWYVSIGSYLRGEISPRDDKELNLLGGNVSDMFVQNETIQFLKFWRIVISSSLGFILLSFLISVIFLNNIANSLKLEFASINVNDQTGEVKNFQQKIEQFNSLVSLINSINQNYIFKDNLIEKINEKLNNSNIQLRNLSFDNQNLFIKILATAKNEEDISKFKKSLEEDPFFKNINLPFSEIKLHEDGKIFSITFSINSSNIR